MKILKIKEQLNKLKVFTLEDILKIFPDFRQATLYDWEDQGYVQKIRNKYYTFSDSNISNFDLYLISNKIYQPSYVSLELALNHYGIIPEAVLKTTAITTRKTQTFETDFGTFIYQSIKPGLFWGYVIINNDHLKVKIADPEKTILDYLYLNSSISSHSDFKSLRFNPDILKELLSYKKVKKYLKVFNNDRLKDRVKNLFNYIDSNA